MSTKITLTPKQKAALVDAKCSGIYGASEALINNGVYHWSVIAELRRQGLITLTQGVRYKITPLGLQRLADDAQPSAVKEEPQELPEHITSRLPEGYMS